MIEIKSITKTYRMGNEKFKALDNVSLDIEKGDFVAIVGQSGSGKSTLMHIIGGIDKPSSGQVLVENENISEFNDKQMSKYRSSKTGFIFQSFNLESKQTALENVMMPLIFSGVPKKQRKEKAMKSLEMVGLKDKVLNTPTQLSGGQRQRVAIARALVNNPEIIFADEPTGNLDSKSGSQIMNLLQELNNKGYTIIMVTHNNEQAKLAKTVIKIKDGMIEGIVKNED
ncbi:MAG TPA: ABC transporter ATP-binding protein [Terrisporobacter glycolicus]|uniref:ABC transporter ATP-binding protein YknY n=1 Tax=Terrisporobacter petrolearius TaxID=1460447 RepID=A0ABZ3FGU0_9FIRM|nr:MULTISPECIES: ABC transporter ATP-binding protein [Terrisporobacter]MBN9647006.1 ABC transporter ATP-binding protein [Terrisporobacter glycolicus]HBI93633.1 ABC transporter ATP-binding protein [Terrisporobacter hibernicus]